MLFESTNSSTTTCISSTPCHFTSMSLSATAINTNLERFREAIQAWEADKLQTQVPAGDAGATAGQEQSAEWQDVVVAFRTRPTLPDEAAKFTDGTVATGTDKDASKTEDDVFCRAISVQPSPPSFVTHVPSMKVCVWLRLFPSRRRRG